VAAMVSEVVSTVQPLVDKNANSLQLKLGNVGRMHTDLTKVRQVLFNLLSNAAKFTREGTISIEASRENAPDDSPSSAWLTFQVTDTGLGISPEHLAHLFVPFTQADAAISRQYEGTGLGLSISQKFCQAMGGEIAVESTLGAGSTFTVRLPAQCPEPPPE
jgi:signal transduction histidine kinase